MLTLAVTALYAKALFGGVFFLDVYLTEVHPHQVALGTAFFAGKLPLWTSDILLGYPLASNPQVGTFYPLHMLMHLFMDADRVIVWSAWLHTLIAAFSTYALAHKGSISPTGAVTAALLYACSPFLLFYHQAIHGLIALALMPLILLITWRAAEQRSLRWWSFGALVIALQMYAGHLQFVGYTLAAALGIALFAPEHPDRRTRLRAGGLCVAQGAVAGLIYAPQLVAAFHLWRVSLRKAMSADEVVGAMHIESLGADDLIELIMPRFFGGPSFQDFWYPEYVGAAAVVAVIAGLAGMRTRGVRVFAGMLAASLTYLILLQIPGIDRLMVSIPGLSAFRAPGRTFCWALLGCAIVAGAGVDNLIASAARRAVPRIAAVAAAVLAAVALVTILGGLDSVAPRDAEFNTSFVIGLRHNDGMEVLLALALLTAGWLLVRARLGGIIVALAVAAPILWVGNRYLPVVDDPGVSPLMKPLKHPLSDVDRVLGISAGDPNYMAAVPGPIGWPYGSDGDPARAGWSLVSNVGMANQLANLHAQTSLPLRRVVRRLFGDTAALQYPFQQHPTYSPDLLAHVGVTHVITTRHGQMPVEPRPAAVLELEGYVVHRLAKRRSPARLYPARLVRGAADEDHAMSLVQHTGPAVDVPLVIEGIAGAWTQGVTGKPSAAKVVTAEPGYAVIEINGETDGVLLYTEAFYPGWFATVDGHPANVLPADGCFLGVPVPAGKHTVELKYVPIDFPAGIPAMVLGLALVVLGATVGSRKGPPGMEAIAPEIA